MVSRREEHKAYLNKVLSNSLTSENPSKETIQKGKKSSSSFYNDLKNGLLKKYENTKFDDFPNTSICENQYGETLKIVSKEKTDFNLKKINSDSVTCDLKIIKGIGQSTEEKLKKSGFNNIESLLNHDKYSSKAKNVLTNIETDNFKNKINYIKENSSNKNNLLKCACDIPRENFKFMDIETLGLSNVPIILIGMAEINKKEIITTQYLLRDKSEEPALIYEFLNRLNEDDVFVTFNGKSFDVPFIVNRANYYRIKFPSDLINYDLMYYARNFWKDTLPDCKLQTIEKEIFNINRINDVPGNFIPNYWETFHEKDNIGPLVPIIKHNNLDVVNLAKFLNFMYNKTCSL